MREIRTGNEQWRNPEPFEWEWSTSRNGNPTTTLPNGTRLVVYKKKFGEGQDRYCWMSISGEDKHYDRLFYEDIEECKRQALRMSGQTVAQPPVVTESTQMTKTLDAITRYDAAQRRIRM